MMATGTKRNHVAMYGHPSITRTATIVAITTRSDLVTVLFLNIVQIPYAKGSFLKSN